MPTIWLGATPSGLISAHLHHSPIFSGRMFFLPPNQHVKIDTVGWAAGRASGLKKWGMVDCQSTEGK